MEHAREHVDQQLLGATSRSFGDQGPLEHELVEITGEACLVPGQLRVAPEVLQVGRIDMAQPDRPSAAAGDRGDIERRDRPRGGGVVGQQVVVR